MVQYDFFGKKKDYEPVKPPFFKGDTLGAKFGNTLIGFLTRIINATTGWFEERLVNFVIAILEKLETRGAEVLKGFIERVEENKELPDDIKNVFAEVKEPKGAWAATIGMMLGGNLMGGVVGSVMTAMCAPLTYSTQRFMTAYRPLLNQAVMGNIMGEINDEDLKMIFRELGFKDKYDNIWKTIFKNQIAVGELINLKRRGEIEDAELDTRMSYLGYNEEDIKKIKVLIDEIIPAADAIIHYFRTDISIEELYEQTAKRGISKELTDKLIIVNRRILGLGEIRSIYYREAKTDEWLTSQLKGFGYSEDDVSDIKKILPYYPAVPDLVRFAVREVYYPDYVAKYGLMDEYPPEYEEAAKKAGLPPEQAKNYWASHWVLPSILQGYEMLHRNVIGSEELGDLFKAVDIMPYWREKLEAISYRVLTRVDVRRMYNLGILDEAGVLDSYKKLGYNDEDAANMTDFTIAYYQQSEKNLTRSNVIDGYKRQYFSLDEAVTMLQELGYDDVEAEFYVAKADYDNEVTKKKDILKLTEEQYKKAIIGDNDVISLLGAEGFQASEVEYHLSRWTYTKKAKTTSPPKEDLKKWLKTKIITREDFIGEMSGLGFSNKYINYYLKEMGQKGI